MNLNMPAFLADLASSKKFKALATLVALWTEPIRSSLGLDENALKWLTVAFSTYFLSQSLRDFGEEVTKSTKILTDHKSETKQEDKASK